MDSKAASQDSCLEEAVTSNTTDHSCKRRRCETLASQYIAGLHDGVALIPVSLILGQSHARSCRLNPVRLLHQGILQSPWPELAPRTGPAAAAAAAAIPPMHSGAHADDALAGCDRAPSASSGTDQYAVASRKRKLSDDDQRTIDDDGFASDDSNSAVARSQGWMSKSPYEDLTDTVSIGSNQTSCAPEFVAREEWSGSGDELSICSSDEASTTSEDDTEDDNEGEHSDCDDETIQVVAQAVQVIHRYMADIKMMQVQLGLK